MGIKSVAIYSDADAQSVSVMLYHCLLLDIKWLYFKRDCNVGCMHRFLIYSSSSELASFTRLKFVFFGFNRQMFMFFIRNAGAHIRTGKKVHMY